MTTLSGKTALVTGASRGIGRARALALAQGGPQVLVQLRKPRRRRQEAVVAEIRKAGGRAAPSPPRSRCARRAAQTREAGRARSSAIALIFFRQRRHLKAATIEDTTIVDFDRLFAVNCARPSFSSSSSCPSLHEGSKHCLVVLAGARAAVGTLSAYSATKGAIDTLVKHFASRSGLEGFASTRSRRALSRLTCRTSPRARTGATTPWACRR